MTATDPASAPPDAQRMGARQRLGDAWHRLRRVLGRRSDSELEMAINRIAFGVAIVFYIDVFNAPSRFSNDIALLYLGAGILLLLNILLAPAPNTPRRLVALFTDIGVLSMVLHDGAEEMSILFPIYLWITLGNGFRFGVGWLYGSMALSAVSFAAVILTSPFWREQNHLSAGLLLGLVMVPLYAGTLIGKVSSARRAAETANKAKSLFLAGVSHELRTPLNAILGMGTLLRGTALDAEQRDMLRTMDSAARTLLTQIEGVLDFSRIESGAAPARLEPVDLLVVMSEVERLLASQAAEKGLEFGFHMTARVPEALLADPRHLTAVLLNLAGNGIKFTEKGGVVIAFDAEPNSDGSVRLLCEVSDSGIGIAQEAQARIFESFTQAEPDIQHRFGGTGLGLAISRRLVQAMDGVIGVRSSPGRGSTFWFTITAQPAPPPARAGIAGTVLLYEAGSGSENAVLTNWIARAGYLVQPISGPQALSAALRRLPSSGPHALVLRLEHLDLLDAQRHRLPVILLEPGAAADLPTVALRRQCRIRIPLAASEKDWLRALQIAFGAQEAEPGGASLPWSAMPRSVLVADDNRINRRVVRAILERAGHRVVLASNGAEALDILDSGKVDCGLMDLNMPGIDGVEALQLHRFAALGGTPLPIIALTADATPEAEARCREAGFDAFLLKPVEPRLLLQTLDRVTAQADRTKEGSPNAATGPIASIIEHPRYRSGTRPHPLDAEVIESLVALGGQEFVDDLARDFLDDATGHLAAMAQAIDTGDVLAFRGAAHGMRSIAANLGARAVEEGCQRAERLAPAEFERGGRDILGSIEAEIARVSQAFLRDSGEGEKRLPE